MSTVGNFYHRAYDLLAGSHPDYRPWHFQWLFLRDVHRWMRERMPRLSGQLLDVGCGSKPYASWVSYGEDKVTAYTGLDIAAEPGVDVRVNPGEPWPLDNGSVDSVLFLQVLEHVAEREQVLREIERVLRPGGLLLATVPFLCPAHGLPNDYARFTVAGINQQFSAAYDVIECVALGKAGAALSNLLLTWIENSLNASRPGRLCKGLLLPLWLAFALLVNATGSIIDALDRTDTHYANVGLLARRR